MSALYDLHDRCEICGRFVNPQAPGVSWRQTWGYCMDGSPDLHDPLYRCSPCTDAHGIGPTNCAANYPGNGRNPAAAGDSPRTETGEP